jgi:hypothetical protein
MASDENVSFLLSIIDGGLTPEDAAQLLKVCGPPARMHAV